MSTRTRMVGFWGPSQKADCRKKASGHPAANVTEEPNESDRKKCDPHKSDINNRAVSCRFHEDEQTSSLSTLCVWLKQALEKKQWLELSSLAWLKVIT